MIKNLLCFIIGHKWAIEFNVTDRDDRSFHTRYRMEKQCCIRCGKPNPNYPEE